MKNVSCPLCGGELKRGGSVSGGDNSKILDVNWKCQNKECQMLFWLPWQKVSQNDAENIAYITRRPK